MIPATRITLLIPTALLVSAATFSICIGDSDAGTPPSRFGKFTSSQWVYGNSWKRENLTPVANPNPAPEPQPRRDHPFDVAVSGDGTKVYITLLGSELEPGSEVAVFDLGSGTIVRRILLKPASETGPPASGPFRLAMHPGGRFLVVTNRFSNFASVIDTFSDEVVSEIPLDFYCMDLAFSKDGRIAWVANRYLDEVFVVDVEVDGPNFRARMRELGGLNERDFFAENGIGQILQNNCGTSGCHDANRGGFVAGSDLKRSFETVLAHVVPGQSRESRLLRAVTRSRDGGYADIMPLFRGHAEKTVVFPDATNNADYRTIADWIDSTEVGPGVPVGNPRSKPEPVALGSNGRYLFVGHTGTQDISIVDTTIGREVGGLFIQNVVNDLKIHRSPTTGDDWLLVATMGVGFGVARERDPWGGESWDPSNPAAQYSVRRDLETGAVLPKEEQEILGPFDAVDGTAGIKFRDIQNDLVVINLSALDIPEKPPAEGLSYLLKANRYESHKNWVRYTSDTAESMYGDIKGDIPPDLMRVVGALPEKMVVEGDRVFVTMQGTNEVQELRIDPNASDPSNILTPVRVHPVGVQPFGIASGQSGTPSEGKLFVANFLGGTISIIDTENTTSREVIVDPSILQNPMPATNAERGEFLVHTALFSSDRDSACISCHHMEMNDGRPWGVSQVVGQEYLSGESHIGQLVEGATMLPPQQRGLFGIQPFFLEGTLTAYDPRSMLMEHCPSDDFRGNTPDGDYTWLEGHTPAVTIFDIQSKMDASSSGDSGLEERRNEFFRNTSLKYFGKSFVLRDFQRFVGEWQAHEPRLMPNPFDQGSASVRRGEVLFNKPQVGCVSCHTPPHFARKDFPNNPRQVVPPQVGLTVRDGSFTLISMHRLDAIAGIQRDLEPWDIGRAEDQQGHFTTLQLRGIWDRPPVFLHHGMARTLREVIGVSGQTGFGKFTYEPVFGGYPERPGRREVGFNETYFIKKRTEQTKVHVDTRGRIGSDTHGGTSQLSAQQIDDLVNFMMAIE